MELAGRCRALGGARALVLRARFFVMWSVLGLLCFGRQKSDDTRGDVTVMSLDSLDSLDSLESLESLNVAVLSLRCRSAAKETVRLERLPLRS